MTADLSAAALHRPSTLEDAVHLLRSVAGARPLAGATWVMRSPVRGEEPAPAYVSLGAIPELAALDVGDREVVVGAGVTHARLATALPDVPELRALRQAAEGSANPAVRAMATVGGNLCTTGFPAADLVPALLALDAVVALAGPAGTERLPAEDFLGRRADLGATLVTEVTVPRRPLRSGHARLTLRAAGDYPVAIVSAALSTDPAGSLTGARVVVGSVGDVPQRWTEVEEELLGVVAGSDAVLGAARRCVDALTARDGVEAPAWYRREVVPSLLARAVASALR